MPTIPLHKTSLNGLNTSSTDPGNLSSEPIINPLPQFLHTPSGLAILEIQGKLNLPPAPTTQDDDDNTHHTHKNNDADNVSHPHSSTKEVPIGRLVFPDYSPPNTSNNASDTNTAWMKRVYLYVGHHQRMVGVVKKLERPLGVLQRRRKVKGNGEKEKEKERIMDVDVGKDAEEGNNRNGSVDGGHEGEELEIVEVVTHRVIFSDRPEPVGREEARYG